MRKRFTSDERATLTPGTRIEWRNGNAWQPGTVAGQPERDTLGMQCVKITNHATTRTVHAGQTVYGYPGMLRPAD